MAGSLTLRAVADVGPGTVMADRYQIEMVLGEGGSGTVHRAWDRMLGELVAIKILHPQRAAEKSWIRRLAREVKVARAIRHPNVCRVFELGQDSGRWFVTMELATGGSLRELLRSEPVGSLARMRRAASAAEGAAGPAGASRPSERTLEERIVDLRALCAGLAAIHAVGIIHRDVTPQNVLRMADGRLVLTDFGLAIEHGDQTTVHGGTPAYLPPEVARGGRSNQRSDVFQLGMIMHEVLTGARPRWSADGARLMLSEPRPGATPVEDELMRLIAGCLDSDPERRPPSAVAVAGRLAAAEFARPAALTTRLAVRMRRFAHGHSGLLKVAAVALLVAGVARTVQIVSRTPLCHGGGEQLAGVWDGARTEAVRRSFLATGTKYAASTFEHLRPVLDLYARSWTSMYTDACEATHVRGEQSAEVLDLRMSCLKSAQVELRFLTDLFSSADSETVTRAFDAASDLTPISNCADVGVLKAVVRPPSDHATRVKVDALRERVSEIKALYGAGRYKDGVKRGGPLLVDVRAVGYDPLIAEALHEYGMVQFWNHEENEALKSIDESMLLAEGSRHDRLLAEAAVAKVMLLGHLGEDDKLRESVPFAEAAVKRVGGDRRLQSWLYNAIADDDRFMGRGTDALHMYEKALEVKRALLGPEHWDVALSLGNVAMQLQELGRNEEALVANERAMTILEKTQHPDLPLHIYNRGEIRLALGQPEAALADFERADKMWQNDLPANHPYFGYVLTGIGLAQLALGHSGPEVIDTLERALRMRESTQVRPEDRAQTEFALARALWDSGPTAKDPQPRVRALALGEHARDEFGNRRAIERKRVEETLVAWHGARRTTPPQIATKAVTKTETKTATKAATKTGIKIPAKAAARDSSRLGSALLGTPEARLLPVRAAP